MEKMNKVLTQEEYAEIQAEITRLEMEQALTDADNSEKIKQLKAKIK